MTASTRKAWWRSCGEGRDNSSTRRLWRRKQYLTDRVLIGVIRQAENGLIDANLGGGLIKQRLARPGQGKSGGFRTIIAYREGNRAVFLLGFAKNEQDNIADDELAGLKRAGAVLLSNTEAAIDKAIELETLWEIDYGNEEEG